MNIFKNIHNERKAVDEASNLYFLKLEDLLHFTFLVFVLISLSLQYAIHNISRHSKLFVRIIIFFFSTVISNYHFSNRLNWTLATETDCCVCMCYLMINKCSIQSIQRHSYHLAGITAGHY